MDTNHHRNDLQAWLETAPGRYLLAWEQAQLDRVVVDLFGFHALQLGLPELDALHCNRMPHRWQATNGNASPRAVALHCDFDALPFPERSLDLVVLPHTLELARDPHLTLARGRARADARRARRHPRLQPASLWGLRQRCGRLRRRLGGGGAAVPAAARRLHRLWASARLAAPSQLRGRGWALRRVPTTPGLRALADANGLARPRLGTAGGRSSVRSTCWWPSNACAACAWSGWRGVSLPSHRPQRRWSRISIHTSKRHEQ